MMTEGKVCLLQQEFLPQLRSVPKPWNFKRAHVNDFSKAGNARSWEEHDWLEWTSMAWTTQLTPTHLMLDRDMDSPFDDDQYLVLT